MFTVTVPIRNHASATTQHDSIKLLFAGQFKGGYATFGTIATGYGAATSVRISKGAVGAATNISDATTISAVDTPTKISPSPDNSTGYIEADGQVNVDVTVAGATPTTANGHVTLYFGWPKLP